MTNESELSETERELIAAFRSGDAAKVGKLARKNAPAMTPAAKDDMLYSSFIQAQHDYTIPLSERIALFMIGRLVLNGHFSRAIYFDGLQNFVRDFATVLREGIIGSYETDQFIRSIKDEAAERGE